jgi:hypothetical protein
MLDETHVSGGPHYAPDLFTPHGKLARLHKGGGSKGATKEARLSREQSAKQFKEQMEMMKRQEATSAAQFARSLEAAKRPVNEPPPVANTADSMEAATAARRMAAKRKGLRYSLFSRPKSESAGASTLLG